MLLISILVVSIFTLFFAASISYQQIKSLNLSGEEVLHYYKINLELQQLKSYAKGAESSQRGYILTKDYAFYQSYTQSIENANGSLDKLKALTFDFQQQKALDSISYLIHERFDFLATVLKTDSLNIQTSDATRKLLIRGRELMTLAVDQINKMIGTEMQLLQTHQQDHVKHIKFSPFSILFLVMLALSGFVVSYVKISNDLKFQTKTNNQLMINKEIFEHSERIANISNWCWVKDENKLIYSSNTYHMLGCKKHEFNINNLVEYIHPDDTQLVFESIQSASQELINSIIFYRIIRKDGALRSFKSSWKIIKDNYGKTLIIGVNADITEQYNKDKMIEDKISDLEKSNKELSAFNHIASHDLQEPLRKVQTFISRIREKNYDLFSDNVKDYFSGIERATQRMQMFIEDLLLYSRASNVARIFEPTDLNELLENTRQELSQAIEEKNARVLCQDTLPVLNVIPFQIQQLFNNLISNSIKYSKAEVAPEITISCRMVSSKNLAGLVSNLDSRYYKISVTDNGIGFDGRYSEDIFTLFYRLHSKTAYSGTGVGLAICKVIIENHKGYIKAESSPGVGSTFSFYLPV
jgi:PAS domain S-box-containing protein